MLCLSALLLPALLAPAESLSAQRPIPGYEQSLRNRVDQFYALMQQARFEDAEPYVTSETRENFRNQPKGPFLSYQISDIKFEPAGSSSPQHAEVVVKQEVFLPGGVKPVAVQTMTRWQLREGAWLQEAVKSKPPTFKDLFKGGAAKTPDAAPQVKFDKTVSDMGSLNRGSKGIARFTFKNITDQPTSVEVTTYCECLVVKGLKSEYRPGEAGEFTVEFDSAEYLEDYSQTIIATTRPVETKIKLLVKANIPRPGSLAKPKAN